MTEPKIKICGLTRPEDAVLCHTSGADYLGIIFARSPRRVSHSQAIRLREAVPQARLVGVFAGASVETVIATADTCRLDLIQLHGDASPDYCETLQVRTRRPIIRAFVLGRIPEATEVTAYQGADFLLFDLPKQDGDQDDAARRLRTEAIRARQQGQRVFLAGRLDATNVRQAVAATKPYGVDVCRGVEKSPGIKDPAAVAQFIREVRR